MSHSPIAVLIGSYARGDTNDRSDCDVLIVGDGVVSYQEMLPKIGDSPINEIRLSWDAFYKYHDGGSLLLKHAFDEGRHLIGDVESWEGFAASFVTKSSFKREIQKIHSAASLLENIDIFGGKYLFALSNAFSFIKNGSIFLLAGRGIYEFNKRSSIRRAIDDDDEYRSLIRLIDFYDYVRKGADIRLPFDPNDAGRAGPVLTLVARKIKEMLDASGK